MIRDSKPILAEPTTQYDEILAALYVAKPCLRQIATLEYTPMENRLLTAFLSVWNLLNNHERISYANTTERR